MSIASSFRLSLTTLALLTMLATSASAQSSDHHASSASEIPVSHMVNLAIRHARLRPRRVSDLLERARLSALLPEVRLAVRHATRADLSERYAGDVFAETERTQLSSDDATTVSATLTWRLSRLVFTSGETALLREQRTRAAARRDLAATVIQLYFQRQRHIHQRALEMGEPLEHQLAIAELTALLDALTGGALSQRRDRAIRRR